MISKVRLFRKCCRYTLQEKLITRVADPPCWTHSFVTIAYQYDYRSSCRRYPSPGLLVKPWRFSDWITVSVFRQKLSAVPNR